MFYTIAYLHKVPLTGLTTMQRLAFFVNIYNTLLFHSHALLGAPKTATAFKALGEKCNCILLS